MMYLDFNGRNAQMTVVGLNSWGNSAYSKATATIDLEVQELCNYRVAGFSEGNGFLGWCWPSQLKAILESLSDPAQSQFFGDSIESFVFSSSSSWIAYANPEMVPILAKFRFG